MDNFYKQIIDHIKTKYKGSDRRMLIRYYNSEVFEKDFENLMSVQKNAGEPISNKLAIECLFESYLNDDEQLDLTKAIFGR